MTKISEKCVSCGLCSNCCSLLTEIRQSPLVMEQRGITAIEAFSCSLCGACETACPQGCSPKKMFADRRNEAVRTGEIDIAEYRYLFPDRKNNVMNAYRDYCGTNYHDLNSFNEIETCFFPGCTLMTYSPDLTRGIFANLKASGNCQGMWTDCCGKPLEQLGLQQRFIETQKRLIKFVQDHQIKRIIVACPGCYYNLLNVFPTGKVVIQSVYEVLNFPKPAAGKDHYYTIHDSCPDRFNGKFGSEVRQALHQCHFSMVEMIHNRKNTICCGSGGQLAHFRPDLTEQLVKLRQTEARQAGADVLVGYCLSCVLKYDNQESGIPVTHALNLLLGLKEDFRGAKKRARDMISGPEGEKKWLEIMAD